MFKTAEPVTNELSLFGAPFVTSSVTAFTPPARPSTIPAPIPPVALTAVAHAAPSAHRCEVAAEPSYIRLHRLRSVPAGQLPHARMRIDETHAAILVDRVGRIAFGLVLMVGFVVLVGDTLAAYVGSSSRQHAALVLTGAWALAIAARGLARLVARRFVRRRSIRRWPSLGASLAISGAGIMLALPLLIHMPIVLAIGGLKGFDAWVTLSACVFTAHLVGAMLVAVRASDVARSGNDEILTKNNVVHYTAIASLVPGALLLMIPVLLVLATGRLCMIAVGRLDRIANREREALGQC